MTNEQKYQIAELRQFGYGYASIADALGLTGAHQPDHIAHMLVGDVLPLA